MARVASLLVVVFTLSSAVASAAPWRGWQELERDFEARVAAEVRLRLSRMPKPIEIRWRPKRIADFDFGNGVLAAAAHDLDRDGREELLILTSRELVAIQGVGSGSASVLARVDLDGGPAVPAVRDPLGAIAISEDEGAVSIWLRTSELARGQQLKGSLPLRVVARFEGVPLCPPKVAPMVPGRNLLVGRGHKLPPLFYALRCLRGYFDESGQSTTGYAVLDTSGQLSVMTKACSGPEQCGGEKRLEVNDTGYAFAAADIDRDGKLEVVSAGTGAPGDRETVRVREVGAKTTLEHKRSFRLGAVAIVIGQFDEDEELEVVSLHRRFRKTPVEVWLWN